MRQTMAVLAVALAAGLSVSTAIARTDVAVELSVGPPPVVYEAVPPPRVGYVWAPGYWDYNGHRHVWAKGHWERERHGDRWVRGEWHEHDGRWTLTRGHWEHG